MFITVKQFAEQRNISGRYVRQLIQDGKITKESWKQGDRGHLIDSDKADQDMADYVRGWDPDEPSLDQKLETFLQQDFPRLSTDALEKIQEAGIEQLTTAEALKLQAHYRGQLLKLEYGIQTGQLVRTDIVARKTFSYARMIRDSILNVPDRIAPEIAAASTVAQVKKILTEAFAEALVDLNTMPDFSMET